MNNFLLKIPFLSLSGEDYIAIFSAIDHTAIISMTDEKGDIVFANDKFVEVSKYSQEELIGQNHRILKSGHQPDEMFVELWKTISGGKIWRGDIKNRAKDGSYYWVDTSIAPILNSEGKPERYIAVRFSITEKKKAESDLINKNKELERFKIALDGTSDQVSITDPNGIILYINSGLEKTTGFTSEEVLGKKIGTRELWGGNMEQEFYRNLWHTIKIDKRPFAGELTNKRKNGAIYQAALNISPLLTKEGVLGFFVAIERDITKEKEIDKAKTEFVSLASHQLRTPLSTINWYTEILLAGDAGAINDEQKDYLGEIHNGSQQMVELVNALLNVSRLELGTFAAEPQPTDIVNISETVIKEMRPEIQKKEIALKEGYASNLPKFNLDPKLTRIIFQNLISNAVKYTPDNGRIEVELKLCKKNEVIGGIENTLDALHIFVSDTGYGIPAEQQDKIFTKLFRADNVRERDMEGTGLGLYMIKSIIEHTGGKIWFQSEENKGTTFHVLLPLSGMKKKEGPKTLD